MSQWTTTSSQYGSFYASSMQAKPLDLQSEMSRQRVPRSLLTSAAAAAELHQDSAVASRHERLAKLLSKHRVRERPVRGDGNCQFRALSDQLYGSEDHHASVRQQVVAQLRAEPGRYQGFVLGSFEGYIRDMLSDGCWGDHVTLQAAADVFGLRIHVLTDNMTDAFIEVIPQAQKSSKVLRLSFWSEVHYNSVEET
mmetsp:Transcript_60913/g.145166  ORF Transcript_60913/g.145166 Transcript_60913/m.145166 type:complete len:196 (-) Transcript_60913:217-804(-)|eukprot:CAMPEP_0178378566 /NCGR_PEP_ID=MMETSP0689_2-20121128/4494_1 /TAXON_ID=160604 /ORGANISM="Amphidinium massartii, Strain CS-259" /LENGTH=195 /DNA_ID=CAMNT_0019998643 /DNA_START=51 /DNA_END=638 /DNA_ORIENTATION=-